jgi:hypothetical protein
VLRRAQQELDAGVYGDALARREHDAAMQARRAQHQRSVDKMARRSSAAMLAQREKLRAAVLALRARTLAGREAMKDFAARTGGMSWATSLTRFNEWVCVCGLV